MRVHIITLAVLLCAGTVMSGTVENRLGVDVQLVVDGWSTALDLAAGVVLEVADGVSVEVERGGVVIGAFDVEGEHVLGWGSSGALEITCPSAVRWNWFWSGFGLGLVWGSFAWIIRQIRRIGQDGYEI